MTNDCPLGSECPNSQFIGQLFKKAVANEGRETAWLVERNGEFWAAGPASSSATDRSVDPEAWRRLWTRDAGAALRFARKQDAETVIQFEGWQHAVATEYMWVDQHAHESSAPQEAR